MQNTVVNKCAYVAE